MIKDWERRVQEYISTKYLQPALQAKGKRRPDAVQRDRTAI